MAIQQIIAARANGFWWTVEADIENYFPSINREILLNDIRKIVRDEQIRKLIELWLNAGILEESSWQKGKRKIEEANAVFYEAAAESIESLVAQRFQEEREFDDFPLSFVEAEEVLPFEEEKLEKRKNRAAVKSLLKEGFRLTWDHKELIGKVLGAKVLGIGGLAIAGIVLTPSIIEAFRRRFHPRKGILQGSPLSPVLANLYLTEFDRTVMRSDSKLVRYCDDFVILCQTKAEAESALQMAQKELAKKNLTLHFDKTRICSPTDEFEFLGYKFLVNGLVEPPPSAATDMAKKIRQMSVKAKANMKKKTLNVKKINVKSWREFFNIFGKRD